MSAIFRFHQQPRSTAQNLSREKIGFGAFAVSTGLVLAVLGVTVAYVFYRGAGHVLDWQYWISPGSEGLLYPLVGTLYLVAACMIVATPIGIAAAIYLSEYARANTLFVRVARFAIESLAGIPSVIYGLFGLAFFVSFLHMRHSILAAAMSVAIMLLPLIIRTSEEAIQSVPREFREASFALGANRFQTVFGVVLPAAFPGIFTGLMLSVGRAIAESAIIILAAGGSITSLPRVFRSTYPFVFPDSGRTLSVHLYYQATSYDDINLAFATGAVLILAILLVNLLAWLGVRAVSGKI